MTKSHVNLVIDDEECDISSLQEDIDKFNRCND